MKLEIIDQYKPFLTEFFASDPALVSKWHIYAGRGLEACVDKTFEDLKALNIVFYSVTEGEKSVGYFCKEMFNGFEALTGFFISPCFRSKSLKSEFWALILSVFTGAFICGVFEKNTPANHFIKSQGGVEVIRTTLQDGPAVYYKLGA